MLFSILLRKIEKLQVGLGLQILRTKFVIPEGLAIKVKTYANFVRWFFVCANALQKRGFWRICTNKKPIAKAMGFNFGGEEGIRTPGPRKRTTVFETAPFDHSGTSPFFCANLIFF